MGRDSLYVSPTTAPNPGRAPASWTQADWYVDWTNGNDNNDGKTAATAVKTVMGGIVAKLGTNQPIFPQSVTWHVLTSQTSGAEEIDFRPTFFGSTKFIINGTYQVIASSVTAGTVTAKNRSTGQQLTVNLGSSIYTAGQIVKNTSKSNSTAYIQSMIGTVATLDQPLDPNTNEIDTWAAGDSLQVLAPTALNIRNLEVRNPDTNGGLGFQAYAIEFPQDAIISSRTGVGGFLQDCKFDGNLMATGGNSGQLFFQNCYGAPSMIAWLEDSVTWTGGNIYYAKLFGNYAVLDLDVAIQNHVSIENESPVLGQVYLASGATLSVFTYGTVAYVEPWFASTIIWGAGSIAISGGGALTLYQGQTFAASLLVTGGITIDGQTTATKYAAGVWTDGVSITAANLDTDKGLLNPRTGSRITLTE